MLNCKCRRSDLGVVAINSEFGHERGQSLMLRCGFFVPGKLTPKEIKFPVQNWQSILFNFNRTETALPSADTSAWLWQDKSRPYLLNDLLETEKTKKSGHVRKHNTPILYSTNRKLQPPAAMNASGGLNLFEKRFKNPKTLKWGGKDYEASTVKVSTNAVS